MKNIFRSILGLTLFFGLIVSCTEDDLEPTLAQNKSVDGNINTAEDLNGVLLGMYNRITSSDYYGRDIIIHGEARSDNAYSDGNSGRFTTISAMNYTPDTGDVADAWEQLYRVIATANIVIGAEVEGDAALINHLKGQAYAVRALAHYDLVRLFGQQHINGAGGMGSLGVPYVKEFKGEETLPARLTVAEVKSEIDNDFQTAISMMNASLNDASKQTISTHAVNALWSRVAIYFGDYTRAVTTANAVISSNAFQVIGMDAYVASWSTDSSVNSIFELAANGSDNNGINGLANIYRGQSYGDIRALADLQTIFDAGDIRNSEDMIGFEGEKLRNLGKYPSDTFDDNINIIRYEEVVLNYAEALLETGGDALPWLNLITSNRGANAYASATKANILQERRRELCFEGLRFDDLVRNGQDIPFIDPLNPGPAYGSNNLAFPIPAAELNANSNMVQNQGYTN